MRAWQKEERKVSIQALYHARSRYPSIHVAFAYLQIRSPPASRRQTSKHPGGLMRPNEGAISVEALSLYNHHAPPSSHRDRLFCRHSPAITTGHGRSSWPSFSPRSNLAQASRPHSGSKTCCFASALACLYESCAASQAAACLSQSSAPFCLSPGLTEATRHIRQYLSTRDGPGNDSQTRSCMCGVSGRRQLPD
jgi:hypothetical protein